MNGIRIGDNVVGSGEPCFIIAEVGINHDGDLDAAMALIDAAGACGADAVKFQNYRTEDFIADASLTWEYEVDGVPVVESQLAMFKRCELAPSDLSALRARAETVGLAFISTPTGSDGLADLVSVGASAVKNGSDFLGNLELLAVMGASGLPTLVSVGMARAEDIDRAVRAYRAGGGRDLVLLLCTSSYPTQPADVHLRKMAVLADAFDCPVGFSDHTQGEAVSVAARALGACVVEKHFTLARDRPGPDHRFSATPEEFARLVAGVRAAEQALGSPRLEPAASEEATMLDYRLSCAAARDLRSGDRVEADDVVLRRPGTGIPPTEVHWVIGSTIRVNVSAGSPLRREMFE